MYFQRLTSLFRVYKQHPAPRLETEYQTGVLSSVHVGLVATTQEGDDTAPIKDPTGPEEDNE